MNVFQKTGIKIFLILALVFIGVVFLYPRINRQAPDNPKQNLTDEKRADVQEMKKEEREGQATAMLSPEKKRLIGIQVVTVSKGPIEKTIRAVGRVAYDERRLARIHLRTEGWIQTLFVNFTGQQVKKHQPLLTLYSPDLLAAQKAYLLARNGQKQLAESLTPEVRESGVILLNAARERLILLGITEQQIQELETRGTPATDMAIHSPVDGVVIRREGTQGMRVTPEMTLYEIADLTAVWVYADVYESELAYLKEGTPANVAVTALPEKTFRGRVAFIDPFLNPETRTVRVRLSLQNQDLLLKPDMFAQVTFQAKLGKGLVIPESAVIDSGMRKIVFVDQGGQMFAPREIEARRVDNHYVIQKGLAAGESIVASANFLIDSESRLMATHDTMGTLGMGGIRMEQAQMGQMQRGGPMGGMAGMEGMDMPAPPPLAKGQKEREASGLIWHFSTHPDPPKEGENLVRLKVTDSAGRPIEPARVLFSYTMPAMPAMRQTQSNVIHQDRQYEASVKFSMPGRWEVTAFLTLPEKPELKETFTVDVAP